MFPSKRLTVKKFVPVCVVLPIILYDFNADKSGTTTNCHRRNVTHMRRGSEGVLDSRRQRGQQHQSVAYRVSVFAGQLGGQGSLVLRDGNVGLGIMYFVSQNEKIIYHRAIHNMISILMIPR